MCSIVVPGAGKIDVTKSSGALPPLMRNSGEDTRIPINDGTYDGCMETGCRVGRQTDSRRGVREGLLRVLNEEVPAAPAQ